MKKIWLDMDTGVDDAIAILCALKLPNIEVVGTSAVGGNQTLEHTFENTRDVLALGKRKDIRVYKGAEKPLVKELKVAPHCHGENGLGNAIIEHSDAPIESEEAIDKIYEKAKELNGEMYLVATGPLTNIALLLRKYPDVTKYIKQVAIMGGSVKKGNATKYAEFNAFVDPHATKEVFDADWSIIMCGLDVTEKAYLSVEEVDYIGTFDNKAGKLLKESSVLPLALYERTIGPGFCIHDGCPVFYLNQADLFVSKKAKVKAVCEGEEIGRTIADFEANDPNAIVVLDVDRDEFAKQIIDIYHNYVD